MVSQDGIKRSSNLAIVIGLLFGFFFGWVTYHATKGPPPPTMSIGELYLVPLHPDELWQPLCTYLFEEETAEEMCHKSTALREYPHD